METSLCVKANTKPKPITQPKPKFLGRRGSERKIGEIGESDKVGRMSKPRRKRITHASRSMTAASLCAITRAACAAELYCLYGPFSACTIVNLWVYMSQPRVMSLH